jgi:hypothetical protein
VNVDEQVFAGITRGAPMGSAPSAKRVAGTDVAANTEISEAVPAGKFWELLAVQVTLAQGATQTPLPTLLITDASDNEVFAAPGASAAQNASVTSRYTWASGFTLTAGAAATRNYAPLPRGLVLPAGWKVKTSTSGIGANSDYGIPSIYVVEFA